MTDNGFIRVRVKLWLDANGWMDRNPDRYRHTTTELDMAVPSDWDDPEEWDERQKEWWITDQIEEMIAFIYEVVE